jgi:hypothetical protein
MRTFNDYLNTPEIADEPLYLREVHAARLKIHDERNGMSGKEFVDSLNAKYAAILEKYGPLSVSPARFPERTGARGTRMEKGELELENAVF